MQQQLGILEKHLVTTSHTNLIRNRIISHDQGIYVSHFKTFFSALQSGTYHGSQRGGRPGVAFRGHVYQPTEMALVMNGGTVSMATSCYHSTTFSLVVYGFIFFHF